MPLSTTKLNPPKPPYVILPTPGEELFLKLSSQKKIEMSGGVLSIGKGREYTWVNLVYDMPDEDDEIFDCVQPYIRKFVYCG